MGADQSTENGKPLGDGIGARGSTGSISSPTQANATTGQVVYSRQAIQAAQAAASFQTIGADGRPLPRGWEMRLHARSGRPYYIDHVTRQTQWERPVNLPAGWERRMDDRGQIYYVDHNSRSTTWQQPDDALLERWAAWQERGRRLQRGDDCEKDPLTTLDQTFRIKIDQFRSSCQICNELSRPTLIEVHRDLLFEDSFHRVMACHPEDLRRRLFIRYAGEAGLDFGGLSREWFFQLSHEVFNPMNCLFEYVGSNNYILQISPASYANPNHLEYFRFIGRFVAMALFHGKFIDACFSLVFYKRMLGRKISLDDIETFDPVMYNSLVFIRDNNVDDVDLGLFFWADYEVLGERRTVDLKPGGKDIKVTEENKAEYLELMVNFRVNRGSEEQMQCVIEGFDEVLPLKLLETFNEKEIELMLCGMQKLDLTDWEQNTAYKNYSASSEQIKWFWKFVGEIDTEKRLRLLQFVTGTCRLPIGGFGELMGSNGPQPFCIERVGEETWLPRSHTCFNRLDLPPYSSAEQLKEKLLIAITETDGFALQ